METPAGIRPDERVLILGVPRPEVVAELAGRLSSGLLVLIGDDEAVRAGRKAARDLDNVMFVPGTPNELPWRDGFFTRIIDTVGDWPDRDKVSSELARVTERS